MSKVLIHWIWYSMLPQLSSSDKLVLLERFSDPEEIFYSAVPALEQLEGLSAQACKALENKDLTQAEEIIRVCRRKDIGIVTFGDAGYPRRLRNIPNPPMVLYYIGTLPDFDALPIVSVVGTRKATAYGLSVARKLSRQIVQCGARVASGCAGGNDTAAMQGALEADAPVIGVLGCGVDVVYPKFNRRLFAQICQKGCLISEYPPGTAPYPWNFPQRNRILSGIANGVLVVEAPKGSGALITAGLALEQGRDVFAVPGNIDVAACVGSNALLKEGATAVCCGWDVVKDYEFLYPGKLQHYKESEQAVVNVAQETVIPAPQDKKPIDNPLTSSYSKTSDLSLTPEEKQVFSSLHPEPELIDEVIARTDLPAGKVLAILTMLSLKGVVINHPGRRVSLRRN